MSTIVALPWKVNNLTNPPKLRVVSKHLLRPQRGTGLQLEGFAFPMWLSITWNGTIQNGFTWKIRKTLTKKISLFRTFKKSPFFFKKVSNVSIPFKQLTSAEARRSSAAKSLPKCAAGMPFRLRPATTWENLGYVWDLLKQSLNYHGSGWVGIVEIS